MLNSMIACNGDTEWTYSSRFFPVAFILIDVVERSSFRVNHVAMKRYDVFIVER